MDSPVDTDPYKPIRRTADDQKTDLDTVVKNIMDEKYCEWPNEAGFDGLKEERGPIEIKVTGTIPIWSAGSLYRTGPGQFHIDTVKGTHDISHWFDGLAHTHRFDIVAPDDPATGKVKVFYSSRRQSEALMRQIKENGRQTMYTFAQRSDPCVGLFGKLMAAFYAATHRPGIESAENICVTIQSNPPGFEDASRNCIDGSAVANEDPTEDVAVPKLVLENTGHRPALPEKLWLASDTCSLREMDPMTMEPIGFATQAALDPSLRGPLSSAHSQRDPETGDLYNFNLAFGKEAVYRVFCVDAGTKKTKILATISRGDVNPAYIHSFFLSRNFVILCIPSSHIAWNGLKVAWERNVLDSIKPFDKDAKCKWFVIDRRQGRGVIGEFETPAGFFFHSVNAFEEIDEQDDRNGTVSLFMDVIQYGTTDVMRALYYDTITQKNGGAQKYWNSEERTRDSNTVLVRYKARVFYTPQNVPSADTEGSTDSMASNSTVLNHLHASNSKDLPFTVVEIVTSIEGPHCGELPSINAAYATKRHRYSYGLPNRGLSTLVDTICKTDMETREAIFWNNPHGHTPGEAIFVARPGAQAEDDGVLLSVVLDGHEGSSYLLCLDALTMKELGRAEMGFAIGIGFHGLHTQA